MERPWESTGVGRGVCESALKLRSGGGGRRPKVGQGQNRTREIRPSGIAGRLVETLAMEKAKRAQKAETPKQPSLHLRLSAPHFYPDHPLRHALIEKLAGTIAQRVPEDVRITRVSVTIRKPVALDNGEPGVTIRREQES
jgi:hypothetical protein